MRMCWFAGSWFVALGMLVLAAACPAARAQGFIDKEKYVNPYADRPAGKPGEPANLPWNLARDLNARLQKLETRAKGADVPLDAKLVRRLNLKRAGDKGELTLFLRNGQVEWPAALLRASFTVNRDRAQATIAAVLKKTGATEKDNAAFAKDLDAAIKGLSQTLLEEVAEVSPAEYVQAKRFLNRSQEGVDALRTPKFREGLNAAVELEARAKSVVDLLRLLKQSGLELTPPLGGDEDVYRELDAKLSTYAK